MFSKFKLFFLLSCLNFYLDKFCIVSGFSESKTKVWGPGLSPDKIISPARYFMIQLSNDSGKKGPKAIAEGWTIDSASTFSCDLSYMFLQSDQTRFVGTSRRITESLKDPFNVQISGHSIKRHQCRVWTNILDRKDGSYIVRYKLYEICFDFEIQILSSRGAHVGSSPYKFKGDFLFRYGYGMVARVFSSHPI